MFEVLGFVDKPGGAVDNAEKVFLLFPKNIFYFKGY